MSGLPSGYTQLEYIQSSGTQYIDTKFKPNGNTRVLADCSLLGGTYPTAFGAWTSASKDMVIVLALTANSARIYYASQEKDLSVSIMNRHILDFDAGTFRVDGTNISSFAKNNFQCSNSIYLFTFHGGETQGSFKTTARYYNCKIYDNGILARDFVPSKNSSGAVGLYDLVNAQFYANAGTGTFTAGPEVFYEPDAPTNFAASVSGQTVALSWDSSANAAGYRLKRDGVQIADQTGTTYTDTVPDGTTLCTYALTAYNDAGESAAVTLLVLVQLELITDRTRADVANQTDKGFYNASDLNRVGAAVEYIAGRFTALGYACPVTVKKDWLTGDAPTASQMETYRQNIVTLRSRIAVMQSTPEAPASMAGLNYVKANNIEQILLDLDALITNITKSWCFSGELYAGEV